MLELELNGILQYFQETAFLFLGGTLDWLALMTAQGTKKKRQAAFAAKHMDALAAHDFAAVGAFVSGGDPRMPRTNHPAVGLDHWRLGPRPLELRNGDFDFGGFDE
jgi:hypothetical protein